MQATRVLVVLALGMVAGCGPSVEVEETLVVYSLDPNFERRPEPGEEWFGERFVLGSLTVTEPERRAELLAEVAAGIEKAKNQPRAACLFEPRHGLHHVAKDGTVTDFVICFKCGDVVTKKNGRRVEGMSQTTRHSQKLLNDTLHNAGVKLANGADKGE